MAKYRRNYPERNKNGNRNTVNNGKHLFTKIFTKKNMYLMLSYWKQLMFVFVISIAIIFGYLGYLETRVNTPFSYKKIVTRTGLDVPELFWGSYRPGLYFGLKTRDPQSLVTGLMWYFPNRLKPNGDGIRHWCEQSDNLAKYGWLQHDGNYFGFQEIQDVPFQLNTSFVKRLGGQNGGEWTARIDVNVLPEYKHHMQKDEQISLIWYAALDYYTSGYLTLVNSINDVAGIEGETSSLGKFKINLHPQRGRVDDVSFLSTFTNGLNVLKETVVSSLRLVPDSNQIGARKIILGEQTIPIGSGPESKMLDSNFVAIQVTAKMPFSIDVVFESMTVVNRNDKLIGNSYTNALKWHQGRFNQRFEDTFDLQFKGYDKKQIQFAQAAFSNMIGGIGYFYGSSQVQSLHTKEPVSYWPAPLYTAVPSRSFFPRGFLWDEGFHGLLIAQWDVDVELDIMAHWFDLINVEGWIPREQILGVEAEAKVPKEFVIQRNNNGNPPTFFLTLQFILKRYESDFTNERLTLLEKLYPRLHAWYQWFNTTQKGPITGSYRWRGRDANSDRELNPKTLTSGLDDFPRASHPTEMERHIDLYCWMAISSNTMAHMAKILGKSSYLLYRRTADYLMDNDVMDKLHWSNSSQRYADYGLHTDDVRLVKKFSHNPQYDNYEIVREVLASPDYRLVDSTYGYVNIFPFILQLIKPTSPKLGRTLNDIRDPKLLWTEYGLRSLSRTSPLYMTRNTEHDPPYWRGQIWININFLTVRALRHYGSIDGPYKNQARAIYEELRNNVVNNVIEQYYKTGYLWEQYNDRTGEGSGCKPFTGWTALSVILMSERF